MTQIKSDVTMSTDLCIRPFKPEDQDQVLSIITLVKKDEEQKELRRQMKRLVTDPTAWILNGLAICCIALSMNCFTFHSFNSFHFLISIGVLLASLLISKRHFQQYWGKIEKIFTLGQDLKDMKSYYLGDRDDRFFFVAEHQGNIVGTAAIINTDDNEEDAVQLWRMFIHPSARRMGVASKLITEVKTKAKIMGHKKMVLKTRASNPAAVKLYQKNGFKIESESVYVEAFPLKYKILHFVMDFEE